MGWTTVSRSELGEPLLLLLERVRLARHRGEPGEQEVVQPAGGERPGQQPPGARGENLRRGEPGGRPRADAACAGDELADSLAEVAGRHGLFALAVVSISLDERRAHEARDLVPGERPR